MATTLPRLAGRGGAVCHASMELSSRPVLSGTKMPHDRMDPTMSRRIIPQDPRGRPVWPAFMAATLALASWGCGPGDAEVEILPSPPVQAPAPTPAPSSTDAPTDTSATDTAAAVEPETSLRPEFVPYVTAWAAAPPAGWEPSRVKEFTAARTAAGHGTEAEIGAGLELAAELLRLDRTEQALAAVQEAIQRQRSIWARETAAGIVSADSAGQRVWLQPPLRLATRAGLWMALQLEALAPGRLQAARYPPGPGGVHNDPLRAGTAISAARQILALSPEDAASAWRLTLAMALAGEKAAAGSQIPDPRFEEKDAAAPFLLTATALDTILQPDGPVGDVAVADFDGDGLADILLADMTPGPGLRLLAGTGDGLVRNATAAAGLQDQLGGTGLRAGDIDGDGDPDLLVLRAVTLPDNTTAAVSLLRNQGGQFTDVTHESGLEPGAVQEAAWLDADGDGDLDLCLVATGGARLLLQTRPFVFEDTTVAAGLKKNDAAVASVLTADVNGDGHADVYLWGREGDRLYLGRGDGTFAGQDGPLGPWAAAGPACFLDAEGDGDLDLLVAPAGDNPWPDGAHPRLLLNRDLTWTEGTAAAGLDGLVAAAALGCADLNGDGADEIYVVAADRGRDLFLPHTLWLNDGGRFRRITRAVGGGLVLPGQAVAVADMDGDGLRDLIVLTGSSQVARPRILVLLRQRPAGPAQGISGSH
ncbi:MAG: FG-GAP-like repeat-containing protein [Acidobacteria bacterium]|nr:FG-GAP-like repeat-containing protein [Acidobacteriota bacterium]